MSFVIALLGAESTGKTTLAHSLVQSLAHSLAQSLAGEGRRVALVGEYLREFCDRHGRTPHQDEQAHIADEQMRRIELAARDHEFVIADTTALMIAVYSELVFGDTSLYARAQAAHRDTCGLTLLTGLDLPWRADGLQRDGPQVREPVDALVRGALVRARVPWSVVYGSGSARSDAALASVRRALAPPQGDDVTRNARWQHLCGRCGDPNCERHRLPRASG